MIIIRAPEFARLKTDADQFDRAIIRSLRRRIKAIAKVGVDAAREELLKDPVNNQPGSVGSREQAAAGIRTVVSFSARGGGVKITATNARMDPKHKGFVAAYETSALRHPVFGNPDVEVEQPTRGWFGRPIAEALPDRGAKEIMAAVDDAVQAMGGTGR